MKLVILSSLKSFLAGLLVCIPILLIPNIMIAQVPEPPQAISVTDIRDLPKLKWQFHTDEPIYASPIISEGLIFTGGLDSVLHALDVQTGKEEWSFKTRGPIRSDVCISGDRLFLNGGDGYMYALNKMNGKLLWNFRTGGEKKYDFADYFHSTPVIYNNIIYFGSGDGCLYAVHSESGLLFWKFLTGNCVHTKPAIDNNKIFFGSFDGYVYALDLITGQLLWKFKTVGHKYFPLGEVQGSPTLFGKLVFIGARDYNVYALDQEKGYCHWNKSFTRGWGLTNIIHDSILYTGSADERVLISADPESGKENWNIRMEFLVFGNFGFTDSMMYVGTTNGKLHGISLKSGKKLWSFETDSYSKNRSKYFKSDDSYRDDIYSIIKSNEQFLDVECELGGIFSTPCIYDNSIIFTSTDGNIYCLKN